MKRSKYVVLFASIFSIAFFIFIFIKNIKPPSDGDIHHRDKPIAEEEQDTLITYKKIENGFIEKPSISLNKDMEEKLSRFRMEASSLAKKFPNTYFTCVDATDKVVALTFDDGPDDRATPRILDILNEYNIPATFFVVGENIKKHPSVFKEIISSGHQIGNHSFSHIRPTDTPTKIMIDDFKKCNNLLDDIISERIKYIRPPYGLVTEDQLISLKDEGFKVIGWSIDSMDWYTKDKDKIIDCVLDAIHPGSIILMHSAGGNDNRKATIDALPIIIETLKYQGYSFVTIEQLMEK